MSAQDPMELLLSHVDDLLRRADAGEVTYTAFLTPGEQMRIEKALGKGREDLRFDGGYPDAERRRLYCLPPYMQGVDDSLLDDYLADVRKESLVALEITGSSFRELAHRDYLGAVLNLGTERSAFGDLCVTSAHSAVLFCDRVMAAFLTESLTRVANDAVRVGGISLPEHFDGGRRFLAVSDTVASPRADGVVAALAGVSRERAQELFRRGLVEIDYETADKPDKPLTEGCVIVIRGKGKFVLRSLSDKTKKGRYRLLADQYL